MFGPRVPGFSFVKVLGGINKTLNVVNQIIPIYKEAKPIVSNARSALNLLKELGNTTTTRVIETTNKNIGPIKEKIKNVTNENIKKGPTFFQ